MPATKIKRAISFFHILLLLGSFVDFLLLNPGQSAAATDTEDFETGETLAVLGFSNVIDCSNQNGMGLGGSTWGMRGTEAEGSIENYYCEATMVFPATGRNFSVEADFDHADASENGFGHPAFSLRYQPAGTALTFLSLLHGVGTDPDRDLLELYDSNLDLIWTSDPGTIQPGTTQNIRVAGELSTISNFDVQADGSVQVFVDDVELVSLTNQLIGVNPGGVTEIENGNAQWNRVTFVPMGRMDNIEVTDESAAPPLDAPVLAADPSPSRVEVTWAAVAEAEQYEVQSCDGVACVDFAALETSTGLSSLSNGTPGTTYRYRARALDTDGIFQASDWSTIVEAVPEAGLPDDAWYFEVNAGSIMRTSPAHDIATAPSQLTFRFQGPISNPFSPTTVIPWVNVVMAVDFPLLTAPELALWQANGTYPDGEPIVISDGMFYWRAAYDTLETPSTIVYRALEAPYNILQVDPGPGPLPARPAFGVLPEWTVEVNIRSATYDPQTESYLGDGELLVEITSDEIDGTQTLVHETDLDWNWYPDNRRMLAGWAEDGELYRVWLSSRRVTPTGPEDPYLIAYHDFSDPFTPAASLTDGLYWYDTTFENDNWGPGLKQFPEQINGALTNHHEDGSFNAYEGVGLDFQWPDGPGATPPPGGGGGGGGSVITPPPVAPPVEPPATPAPTPAPSPAPVVPGPGLPRTGIFLSFLPGYAGSYLLAQAVLATARRIRQETRAIKKVVINGQLFTYS